MSDEGSSVLPRADAEASEGSGATAGVG